MFRFRRPSLTKRIAARTSWKRAVRHRLGLKAPRGLGWLTNPRKALQNRIYRRTTFGIEDLARASRRGKGCLVLVAAGVLAVLLVTGAATGLLTRLVAGWLATLS